ncbi:TonB-dependent receptor [Marinicauda algicola]|uniref:TonB-dependent receptor n=1 Tax=Marinicauda algicola TaxID=2029849 RepID=A0A4S2GVZ9_9PROT|nr:TonB-dependent receptor [Marinicauda algicola]TGY87267.1 TonB-dependent receptor [Marinicauda algicola]
MPLRLLSSAAPAALAAALAAPAMAQDEAADIVTVIGGRAPGAQIEDRPVTLITREAIEQAGFADLGDALAFLPSVTGSEFNEDPGTQNDTSGTSSVNLRGLGLGSTLVLMNGQRQTVASVSADDGASFVDMNALVPTIAISRVEVLKDGASPVYGSDAVAGVINVHTRDDFQGVEAHAELRGPTQYEGSGAGYELAAIAGRDLGAVHLVAALEWLDREGLGGFETGFVPGTGLSLGQPGSYLVPSRGFASYADPFCTQGGGILVRRGPDDATGTPGSCLIDYAQFFSVVTEEERLQGFAALTGEAGDTRFALRVSGADQHVERGNSPSLPNLDFPLLDASLAGNVFGEGVIWLGRPLGAKAGAARRRFDHETVRVAGELARDIDWNGTSWTLQLNATYSRNDLRATITDTLEDNFNLALDGFGGASCPGPNAGVAAGDESAGCYFFNPFGSGVVVTDPSDPRFNAPEVIDFIIGQDIRDSRADLTVIEAVASTPSLLALPAGDVSAAFGVQTRRETLRVEHGEDFNADNFLFIIGGPDYSGALDARAVFADAIVPVTERFELQLAARHEDIDGFASTDPKIAAVFEASEALTLRASWSRSFRAPSLHQRVSATTTLQSLFTGSASSFLPVRTVGNENLDPETADTFTLGAVWSGQALTAGLDLWRIEYEDLIVEENPNAILAADLADDGIFNDPRVELSSIGDVRLVRASFVNAPKVEAQGLDASLAGRPVETRYGMFGWGARASYVDEFTLIDPVLDTTIDGAGNRNFTNFARSVPDYRASAWIDWARAAWDARAGLRHISSYDDDENPGNEIDAWTVLDLQAGYTFDAGGTRTRLVAGALNLTDEQPPFVDTPLGYDTKVHDARGRVAYVRVEFVR